MLQELPRDTRSLRLVTELTLWGHCALIHASGLQGPRLQEGTGSDRVVVGPSDQRGCTRQQILPLTPTTQGPLRLERELPVGSLGLAPLAHPFVSE